MRLPPPTPSPGSRLRMRTIAITKVQTLYRYKWRNGVRGRGFEPLRGHRTGTGAMENGKITAKPSAYEEGRPAAWRLGRRAPRRGKAPRRGRKKPSAGAGVQGAEPLGSPALCDMNTSAANPKVFSNRFFRQTAKCTSGSRTPVSTIIADHTNH